GWLFRRSALYYRRPAKPMSSKVSELAALVDGRVLGEGNLAIEGVASLDSTAKGEISYLEDKKLFATAPTTRSSSIIVPQTSDLDVSCQIKVNNPKLAFAVMANVLHPVKKRASEIHASAV